MSASDKRIFISYRRDDTAPYAGWLHELLAQRFGRPSVFKDVTTVRPGMDFTKAITEAVAASSVLIVLIGPSWELASDGQGRRLEDPKDWVRVEIESALDKNILVIPVLVRGVPMPSSDSLPASLRRLTHMQALQIDYESFQEDVKRLVYAIEAGESKLVLADPLAARREHGRTDRFAEMHRLFRTRIEEQLVTARLPWRQAGSFRAQLDALVDALDADEEVVNLALAQLNDGVRHDWATTLQSSVLEGLVALTPRRLVYAPRPASLGLSFISCSEILDVSKNGRYLVRLTLTLPDRNVQLMNIRPHTRASEFARYLRDRIRS